jgi:hypothetical protein
MLFIIGYGIIGGGIAFGLLYLMYRQKTKNNNLKSKSFLCVVPPIIGVINCVLDGIFILLYILNPASFSSEQSIVSPIAYVLFTIFSIYFYMLALPLSIGCAGISVVLLNSRILAAENVYLALLQTA